MGGQDGVDLIQTIDFHFEMGGVWECSACGE